MSWGDSCPSAILFAATYPARVSRLVLVNPYARYARGEAIPWGMPAKAITNYVALIQEIWGTGRVSRNVAPSLVSDATIELWARNERLSASPDGIAAMERAALESDVSTALGVVQAPTLVVTRRGDRHVRAAHGRYVAEGIPDAKLVELEGDDHVLFSGDVDAVIDVVQEFLTGGQVARPDDRVLATVLFTDIVGSTTTAAAVGDQRWHGLLARHREIVRRDLEAFRGQEIDTAGDGFLILFDGPARAIQCARTIQEDLRGTGISIRAGIHTGEVLRTADQVDGIAVHIGARIAALASESETLVSRTVVDLVVGSGIEFVDRGSHELKGVPGKWQLFQVA